MRASGVRRSCEMPARITARSFSTCARSSTIWLKLRFASTISCEPFSGSGAGFSPLAKARVAAVRRASGRLIRLEMSAAPSSDTRPTTLAQPSHCTRVRPARRSRSSISQYWSSSMLKLIQKPAMPFTRLEKRVCWPSLSRTAAAMSGISALSGGGSTWSESSSEKMRMPSFDTSSSSSSRRISGAEWVSAALVMVTTETTSSAVCCTCGPRWNTFSMPIHEPIDSVVSRDIRKKVRQNRPLRIHGMRPGRGCWNEANTSAAVLQG